MATPYVFVNEVSTIVAAYAFSGFASDALHVSSSGTALANTGMTNAFLNAANLANLATGVAYIKTPSGNGTVPQSTINTLANILAACVNSAGPSSTSCSTLLSNAVSPGSIPSDTATAAINIAHYPSQNVAALYGIPVPAAPFSPTLSTQPNDLTIGLNFTGSGLTIPVALAIDGSGNVWIANRGTNYGVIELSSTGAALSGTNGLNFGSQVYPTAIAIDHLGNAWITNPTGVTEISSSGIFLSGSSGFSSGGNKAGISPDLEGVAIDLSGNAWIANYASNTVQEYSSSGVSLSGTTGGYALDSYSTSGPFVVPFAIAVDGSNNAWVTNTYSTGSVTALSSTGSLLATGAGFTGGGINEPVAIAVDHTGDVWTANYGNNSISKLNNSGSALSGSGGVTGGGMDGPDALSIDGAGSVWVASFLSNSIVELSKSASVVSGTSGYTGGGIMAPISIAVDGSGNVWDINYLTGYSVTELIGAAAPVITPICAGLPSTPSTGGTSNLGTRP